MGDPRAIFAIQSLQRLKRDTHFEEEKINWHFYEVPESTHNASAICSPMPHHIRHLHADNWSRKILCSSISVLRGLSGWLLQVVSVANTAFSCTVWVLLGWLCCSTGHTQPLATIISQPGTTYLANLICSPLLDQFTPDLLLVLTHRLYSNCPKDTTTLLVFPLPYLLRLIQLGPEIHLEVEQACCSLRLSHCICIATFHLSANWRRVSERNTSLVWKLR